MFGEALKQSFDKNDKYTVVLHDVTEEITQEKLASDIRACLKVVIIFSR